MSSRISLLIPDLFLSIPIFLLCCLSILVIYSSSPILALNQSIFIVVGLVLFVVTSYIDFKIYDRGIYLVYIGILFLLLVTFLIGFETRGSVRWIPLGFFQLQPSELAKPILIILLAHFWANRIVSWKGLFFSLLLTSPLLLIVFRQPDLGTTLVLFAIWFFSLIGANISYLKLIIMSLVIAPIVYLGQFLLKDYQRERLISFLSPSIDPLGIGYNAIQSTIAVGSGQLMGRGLGRGTQSRLQFLPEFRTDFVFASIAEEFGFLGSMIVITLYLWLVIRSLMLLRFIQDRFGVVVIFGVLGMILSQVIINIGMNIGLLPITGITLPLLSYGGSSIIGTMICLGCVASCCRYYIRHPL